MRPSREKEVDNKKAGWSDRGSCILLRMVGQRILSPVNVCTSEDSMVPKEMQAPQEVAIIFASVEVKTSMQER